MNKFVFLAIYLIGISYTIFLAVNGTKIFLRDSILMQKINTVWRINDRTINGIICNLSEKFVPLCCERTIEEFHYNKRASKTETCVYSKFPWITKFPALMLAASINVVHLVHTENLRTRNVFTATAWNTESSHCSKILNRNVVYLLVQRFLFRRVWWGES